MSDPLVAVWLGRMGFAKALALQLDARERLADGQGPPILFLVEHPPTLTLGRRAARGDILWTDAQLAAAGVAVCETPRGGQVTLHAPGQLVVYPVIKVGRYIRDHLVRLGESAVAVLEGLGVTGAEFRMDHPGVWLGSRKLASIGIHVRRGITVQGLSLNLDVDSGLFFALVSCGLAEGTVTSARAVGGAAVSVDEAARRFARVFAEKLGSALEWRPLAALGRSEVDS
ncbi:MAG: lipoyl(octanoyl) transferase LipB [Myxococcales bacterium]|nr:lipoyl(octanoyl) transferase LipB [Myxococcales bacterium]